jgi:hypothetical protein
MAMDSTIPRRDFIKAGVWGSAGLIAAGSIPAGAAPRDRFVQGFARPPAAAKPHTLWHWMDGNVSKAGITADLEAMQRIGLGGAMIYSLSYEFPPGPVRYASPQWRAMIRHAAAEASRLGLELGMHNCSGWSSTGGPWVRPDLAMQKVVWGETRLSGAARFSGVLPRPFAGKWGDHYRDIAVLACRAPKAEQVALEDMKVQLSTSLPNDTPRSFGGRTTALNIAFATPSQNPQYITLSFDRPFTARGLCLAAVAGHGSVTCTLEISDDNKKYRPAARFVLPRRGMPNINFAPVTARYFRLAFTGEVLDSSPFVVGGIDLATGYRLSDWAAKAGFALMDRFTPDWDAPCPPELLYRCGEIVDLSERMGRDGRLEWEVPDGDWTILRFGYAPTGATNIHAEAEGSGLEVDKMNPKALDAHFEGLLDAVLSDLGPLAGQGLDTILADSYEVGPQNWTGAFPAEFRQRCGYDIVPLLPALTGRIIDSPETTERILWDLRHTIAALFTENYYGHFRTRCHEKGLKFASEPYVGPFSPIDCGSVSDLPIGEFWTGKLFPENKSVGRRVVAGAHLNGRSVVGAEAFTSRFDIDRFTLDPAALKADGDAQFCEGITRFIFHRFAHQPWLDKAPGMTMGPWGLHFDRTVTWWEPGRAWIDYLTRCQHLLQSGKPVTDILCFDGEDGQALSRWGDATLPVLPAGYDFEFTNPAFLLTAEVEDGAIVLANGVRYRLLALPDMRYLSLPLVRKLAVLVNAGAVIAGAPPLRVPGFAGHAAADAEIGRIVTELWGDCDGKTVTQHRCGKGTVYWGIPLAGVLAARGIEPDFAAEATAQILFKHRSTPEAEIYFVSNQEQQETTATCRFRVRGKAPEIWNPETAHCEPAVLYREDKHTIAVPLTLGPAGSLFVVFRNQGTADHAVAASDNFASGRLMRRGKDFVVEAAVAGRYAITTAKGRTLHADAAAPPAPLDISAGWNVAFPPGSGAPEAIALERLASLSLHPDTGVRYFSGTATYTKLVHIPPAMLGAGREITLDLGEVKNLARVRVNGVDFGVLWKPPFRCPVTAALKPGKNRIELQVTNLWVNRLIGDEQLADDCAWIAVPDRGARIKEWPQWLADNTARPGTRVTFTTWKFYAKDDALAPSGLIGPVRLQTAQKVLLHP